MPTYSYRCLRCGHFDVPRAMAARAEEERCPGCGVPAPRVVTAPALHRTAPGLRRTAPGLRRALTAAERSADAPQVVTSVPHSPRAKPVTTDPRHLRLPRP